MILVENRNW